MMDPNASTPATEDAPLSAYEKAGAEDIDPRCIPQNLDGPPPVGDEIETPEYPEEDNANWRFLFERQKGLETLPIQVLP